uniref:Uncharacterized protein n=1 Tax=Ananas comosus var. bracteatus TaxID=296719 RepID=A0A6V7QBY0_ANACO|nr:unnamed protein product [Ananas comosus var. bracteatus]
MNHKILAGWSTRSRLFSAPTRCSATAGSSSYSRWPPVGLRRHAGRRVRRAVPLGVRRPPPPPPGRRAQQHHGQRLRQALRLPAATPRPSASGAWCARASSSSAPSTGPTTSPLARPPLRPGRVNQRCAALVPRVRHLVRAIIADHHNSSASPPQLGDTADFVDVLLSLQGDEKLEEDDMIAVLWEMIFRGTDTTALLTEWAMAELVLHPEVQSKLRCEIDAVVGPGRHVTDTDVARMPYLQAVVKETLRAHPPGPLLSWARLSTEDVRLGNGMVVPAGTTAMVNMWAITHDPAVWARPEEFSPERFVESEGGADVDVRGGDLRLAPFGRAAACAPARTSGSSPWASGSPG